MKFRNRNDETVQMVENICLILSLGAIFVQIWALMSGVESYLEGKHKYLIASLILSALCLACSALTAFTTTLQLSNLKNSRESR